MVQTPFSIKARLVTWFNILALLCLIFFLGSNPAKAQNPSDPANINCPWGLIQVSGAPQGRSDSTAVWTGSEMIVWGGTYGPYVLGTGGRYNPVTDTWTATSTTGAPSARSGHHAVWTGEEMIIWGGTGYYFPSGGRYNPVTDNWVPVYTENAPLGIGSVIWTGSEMIVWGGESSSGRRYNPITDHWAPISTIGAPSNRSGQSAVWTGKEMIIWGGRNQNFLNDGARYNPVTDTWSPIANSSIAMTEGLQAFWTGSATGESGEMIVWSGWGGGQYNPSTNQWKYISNPDDLLFRIGISAVWTGTDLLVWGGGADWRDFNTGWRYNPVSSTWTPLPTDNDLSPRYRHSAVWTGSSMIIWGGALFHYRSPPSYYFNDGAQYHNLCYLMNMPVVQR